VTNDIETLITALYVKIDDELGGPRLAVSRDAGNEDVAVA
jgi:hypothetical protein